MGSYQLCFPSLSSNTPQTPTITVSSSTSRDSHYIGSKVTAATNIHQALAIASVKREKEVLHVDNNNNYNPYLPSTESCTQHPSIHRHTARKDNQQWSSSAGRGKHAQWNYLLANISYISSSVRWWWWYSSPGDEAKNEEELFYSNGESSCWQSQSQAVTQSLGDKQSQDLSPPRFRLCWTAGCWRSCGWVISDCNYGGNRKVRSWQWAS